MQKILLVEDNAIIRWDMRNKLEQLGYDVSEAGSLKEATALIAQDIFDVLITDTNLAGIGDTSGVEVARLFREKFPEGKIIALSAEERNCWNATNCDLFTLKINVSHGSGLARVLTSVVGGNN